MLEQIWALEFVIELSAYKEIHYKCASMRSKCSQPVKSVKNLNHGSEHVSGFIDYTALKLISQMVVLIEQY